MIDTFSKIVKLLDRVRKFPSRLHSETIERYSIERHSEFLSFPTFQPAGQVISLTLHCCYIIILLLSALIEEKHPQHTDVLKSGSVWSLVSFPPCQSSRSMRPVNPCGMCIETLLALAPEVLSGSLRPQGVSPLLLRWNLSGHWVCLSDVNAQVENVNASWFLCEVLAVVNSYL